MRVPVPGTTCAASRPSVAATSIIPSDQVTTPPQTRTREKFILHLSPSCGPDRPILPTERAVLARLVAPKIGSKPVSHAKDLLPALHSPPQAGQSELNRCPDCRELHPRRKVYADIPSHSLFAGYRDGDPLTFQVAAIRAGRRLARSLLTGFCERPRQRGVPKLRKVGARISLSPVAPHEPGTSVDRLAVVLGRFDPAVGHLGR